MDFDNRSQLIECFKDRIYSYYIEPAKLLDENKIGFGCGLLCTVTIDSLARLVFPNVTRVGCRFRKWLKNNLVEFNQGDFAERFYEDFRCGLVHEGRIKNPREFSYEQKHLITRENGIIRINPHILLENLVESIDDYISELNANDKTYAIFRKALQDDFANEVERERLTE